MRAPIVLAICVCVANGVLDSVPGRPLQTLRTVIGVGLFYLPSIPSAWAGWRVVEKNIGGIRHAVLAGLVVQFAFSAVVVAFGTIGTLWRIVHGTARADSLFELVGGAIIMFWLSATGAAIVAAIAGFVAERRFRHRHSVEP